MNNTVRQTGGEDIAIVGMACVYPGARDMLAYWRNILDRVNAVGAAPADWRADLFLDPQSKANDRIYTDRGGFLGDLASFDPLRHGVMPSSIDGGEPDQFLALEIAEKAVADAGFADRPVASDRVAVILGRGTYINRGFTTVVQHGVVVDRVVEVLRTLHPETPEDELAEVKARLKASLPPFNAEIAPALVPNLVTGRISNRLDFRGANYIVDAACASALVALERGVADLRAGLCDMAVVGGVHASTPPPIYMIFCQLEALSRKGRIAPFAAGADGTLLGEGVGILCIKRLADAEAAGERIYALVKSVGVASDGRGLGILAPRLEGETAALNRAYGQAGIDPRTIGLVEAHGTATRLGDATEVAALKTVFGTRRGAAPDCALGAVKSMIGHCLPASGSAGIIKAALALHHKVLPPTLLDGPANPDLGLDETPFFLNTEARPWIHALPTPRRAGVNAFGFGGINAHAVLEEYQPGDQPVPAASRSSEAILLAAETADALLARVAEMTGMLTAPGADLAAVARLGGGEGPWRLGIVAAEAGEAAERLQRLAERVRGGAARLRDRRGLHLTASPELAEGRMAFMFPGEGSQHAGMLRELLLHRPEMRGWFDLMDSAFVDHPRRFLPSQAIYPADGATGDTLWQMDIGPEAIFAADQAVAELYARLGLRPDMLVGHSTGEYAALYCAGVTRRDDPATLRREILALNAVYEAARADGSLARAQLLAVGAVPGPALEAILAERPELFLAMDNCGNQKVLACADPEAVGFVQARVGALGGFCEVLPFDRGYHSPLFAPFAARVRGLLDAIAIAPPAVPVYSCLTAAPFPEEPEAIRALAAEQWAGRVRFTETVERLYADGARVFVECGPRNNLSAFVDDILRKRPHLCAAVDTPARQGLDGLNHFAAELFVAGAAIDPLALIPGGMAPRAAEGPSRPQVLKMGIQPVTLAGWRPERRPDRSPAAAEPPSGAAVPFSSPAPAPRSTSAPLPSPAAVPSPAAAPVRPAAAVPAESGRQTAPVALAGSTAAPSGTVPAGYFEMMEAFLETEQAVMQAYLGAPAPVAWNPAPTPPEAADELRRWPMIEVVERSADGTALAAHITFDTLSSPYLLDHTLGRDVSDLDPGLTALPVTPLTFSMEALAEAATALRPDLIVTGMREVRASRWIALDTGPRTLRLEATLREAGPPCVVRVRLRESGQGPFGPTIVEADLLLDTGYPAAPAPSGVVHQGRRGAPWTLEQVYDRIMFHGPRLQAVAGMDAASETAVEGVLVGVPQEALFTGRAPAFETDAVTLDAVGQLVGVWSAEMLDRAFHIFPFRVEAVDLFDRPLAAGSLARCTAQVALVGADEMRSDIEVIGGDGRLVARIASWWDKRFELPDPFFHLRRDTLNRFATREVPGLAAGLAPLGIATALVDDLDNAFLSASGELWPRVLAHLVLSRAERADWTLLAERATVARRWDWIRGRLAAKDAVRRLVRSPVRPADVAVASDATGRPIVSGAWPADGSPAPLVSISHSGGQAVALAADPARWAGIGIDIETVEARPAAFEEAAFAPDERRALDACNDPAARALLATRIWCAREAAAKAIGGGLGEILRGITALPEAGSTSMRVLGAGLPAGLKVKALEIAPGLVAAVALLPSG